MEEEILQLLEQNPGNPYSAKEIGKRLDRELYRAEPNWAREPLQCLLQQRRIETDPNGYYFHSLN